ncbi:sigma-70 family RNA polymerase sigma factor [Streptomyces albofaciens JCM 4342]|uniref:sigma-70 family RNA polymerase sigma factor n=1 Tax=Streptomyces albofaciens TaxID=66866 RepID=UPI0012393E55|nr:sigma-70 family RNA polymerase sigma factor [Streptomyces albofaciens]KAA6223825.1 sigma-70 family RNA polymerase sigma factor [Streptomyces albofaciens JCM 4342]
MDARDGLAERFEEQRDRLRAVAYRMLGSPEEADDAVQEAWLRLGRVDADAVDNLGGWLRTVVTRICLDALRARTSRREDLTELRAFDEAPGRAAGPEATALLTDSVGRALLVVLDRLGPAERVAFVLHDMYAVPFQEIAPVVERTPAATKKLASRARQKVRGTPAVPAADLARHRHVITEFLKAARAGDLPAVLALLAPDVVRRADPAALPPGAAPELRGARAVAEGTLLFAHRSRQAEPALVNGTVGLLVAPRGRLRVALTFTVEDDRITGYEVIADPARLRGLEIGVLD